MTERRTLRVRMAARPVLWLLLGLALLFGGCQSVEVSPEPTPAAISELSLLTMPDGLTWQISSDSAGHSEAFSITADGALLVQWESSGAGIFVLALENQDPAASGTPSGTILLAYGRSARGAQPIYLAAGDYRIVVERAEGPWTVALRRETGNLDNLASDGEVLRLADGISGRSPDFELADGGEVLLTWSVAPGHSLQWALVPHADNSLWPAFQPLTGEGSAHLALAPGNYHIEIQMASGPWTLWLAATP